MTVCNKFLLAVMLVTLLGLAFVPMPQSSFWVQELFNTGHTFLFLIISIVLFRQLDASGRFPKNWMIYVLVVVTGILLGVFIELLQQLTAREVSLQDIYRDLAGIVIGLLFTASFSAESSPVKTVGLLIVCALLLVLSVRPLTLLSWHYYQRSNQMPVLFESGARWTESFIRLNNAKMEINDETSTVTFQRARFPAIRIIEPESDWRRYRFLYLDLYSDHDEVIEIFLRVHDRAHNYEHDDRFNKKLIVKPGLNSFKISLAELKHAPNGRTLDISKIAELALFASEPASEFELSLGDIYLK